MKFIIMFFLLSGLCFAEEFKINKAIDPGELVEEIETLSGLILTGKNQVGVMSTAGDKIFILLKDGELTQIEKNKIVEAIKIHIPKTKEQKETEKQARREAIKLKLNLTNEETDLLIK